MGTGISVLVALFSVFGFYCGARILFELLFSSDRLAVAVEVRSEEDVSELDFLLREAHGSFLRRRAARLVVLISVELMNGTVGAGEELFAPYRDLLDRYGADCYLIDP